METLLDFAIVGLLNICNADWDSPFPTVKYSNAVAVAALALIGIFSPFLITLYLKNLKILNRSDFKEKYGSALEGTNLNKKEQKWSIVVFPASFFARRIIFAVTLIIMENFVVA